MNDSRPIRWFISRHGKALKTALPKARSAVIDRLRKIYIIGITRQLFLSSAMRRTAHGVTMRLRRRKFLMNYDSFLFGDSLIARVFCEFPSKKKRKNIKKFNQMILTVITIF